MPSPRDEKFDFIKGVLIFFVVWAHLLIFFCDKQDGKMLDPLWIFVHSFHMPLFVFISGYFAYNNIQRSFTQVFVNSINHLLVPQIIYVLFSFSVIFVFSPKYNNFIQSNGEFDIKKIYHLITLAWYLWCIFFCLIFTNVLFHITKDMSKVMFISALVFILMNLLYKYLPGPIFINQQFSRQLIFFTGGLFYRQKKQVIDEKKKIIFFIVLICYIALAVNYELWWNYYYKVTWFLFSVPLFFIIFEYLFERIKLFPKIKNFLCKYLGQNTLGIYLIHVFIFRFMSVFFHIESAVIIYAITFLLSIIVCFLCLLIIFILKKNKVMKLLFLGERK